MDSRLLDQAVAEAKAFQLAKGRTSERAEKLAQASVEEAVKWANSAKEFSTFSSEEKAAYKAHFFETIGVSKKTARSLAASM